MLYNVEVNRNISQMEELDGYKLIQFTGLKDKNGKEIYEGDILEFDDQQIGGYRGVGVVIYCADLTIVNAPSFILEMSNGLLPNMPFQREIIGNIFENPELLE